MRTIISISIKLWCLMHFITLGSLRNWKVLIDIIFTIYHLRKWNIWQWKSFWRTFQIISLSFCSFHYFAIVINLLICAEMTESDVKTHTVSFKTVRQVTTWCVTTTLVQKGTDLNKRLIRGHLWQLKASVYNCRMQVHKYFRRVSQNVWFLLIGKPCICGYVM